MSVGAGGAEGREAACRGGSATELAAGASLTFEDAELSSAGTVSSALAVCVRLTSSGCGAGCTEGGRPGILDVSRNGRGETAEAECGSGAASALEAAATDDPVVSGRRARAGSGGCTAAAGAISFSICGALFLPGS